MANNSDGSAVYQVKVGEDDYIDGLDVTESDGSITTYLVRWKPPRSRGGAKEGRERRVAGEQRRRHRKDSGIWRQRRRRQLPERPPRSARLPPRTPRNAAVQKANAANQYRKRIDCAGEQCGRRGQRRGVSCRGRREPGAADQLGGAGRRRRIRYRGAAPSERPARDDARRRDGEVHRHGCTRPWPDPRRRCPGRTVSFGGTCSVSGSTVR